MSLPALAKKKQISGRPGRALFAKQSFKKIASAKKRPRKDTEILYIFPWIQIILWILLLLSLIPLWIYSHSYPYGGWDAWQVWNLKAKFLFLGGENWKNIFHESLWRSSPHYPLLLPIINVWGWIFSKDATYSVPLFTALIFSIALVGLLSQAIYRSTRSFLSILPVLLIFTHPLLLNLTISQYADLPFAFYLFAGLFCLYQAKTKPLLTSYFLLLTSLFLSFLSFTKPEGLIAAIVVIFLSLPYLLWENNLRSLKKIFLIYLISLFIAFLPSIVFYGLYAPKNITFINGFLSTAKPSDLNRLKIIAMYYVLEIFSAKWNGLWILLLGGFILSIKKCFTRKILIFPAFLLIYSAIIILYYQTNTYFEIGWWLQSTLHRILFTLLPTIIFWIFTSLAEKQTLNSKP